MTNQVSGQSDSIQAVRLIFEYEGDQVRLVSQQAVDMAVTEIDLTHADEAGVFVETRDAADAAIARVPAHSALSTSAEVFPERLDEPIMRVNVPVPKGAFTVVVPATGAASEVVVVRAEAELPASRTAAPPKHALKVIEIARFPLEPEPQP